MPGKALLEIAGKPMICRVVERTLAARNVSLAIVATDDERILDAVKSAGYEAVMTRAEHRSGTDRIAEVAASIEDAVFCIYQIGGDSAIPTLKQALSSESDPCVSRFIRVSNNALDNKRLPGQITSQDLAKWYSAFSCNEVEWPSVITAKRFHSRAPTDDCLDCQV